MRYDNTVTIQDDLCTVYIYLSITKIVLDTNEQIAMTMKKFRHIDNTNILIKD